MPSRRFCRRTATAATSAVALICALSGCRLSASSEAGWFRPSRGAVAGESGVAASVRAGHRVPAGAALLGLSVGLRTKVAADVKQYAVAADVAVSPRLGRVVPFLRGGANIYQAESLAGEFAYGMFSPYIQAGLMVQLFRRDGGTRVYFSAAGAAEYTVRFTSQPNRGYLGVIGGITIAAPRGESETIRFSRPHK